MVYIYNRTLLSHTKEQSVPFVETWMDLEPVLHSGERPKEKNKYCLLTLVCRIQKNGTDKPICKAEIKTEVENKCMETKQGKQQWDELGDWD